HPPLRRWAVVRLARILTGGRAVSLRSGVVLEINLFGLLRIGWRRGAVCRRCRESARERLLPGSLLRTLLGGLLCRQFRCLLSGPPSGQFSLKFCCLLC